MQLSDEREQRLLEEACALEGNVSMRHVTSAERFGIKDGRQQGRQEVTLPPAAPLFRCFGYLPEAVRGRLAGASTDQIETWAIGVLDAEAPDAVVDQH